MQLALGISCLLLSLPQANAQLSIRMTMSKTSYLLNEPVTATLHITNHAGRQIILRSDGVTPWLNFHLSNKGRTIPSARRMNYRSVVIPTGQTVARTVNLSTTFSLGNVGNYTCTANIKMPGQARNGFISNRCQFTVATGRASWTQRAGVPGSATDTRIYKLVNFTGNRSMELYAQVDSGRSGANIATIPLGKVISFRQPVATLDRSNNMHTVYQVKPDLFTYVKISPSGRVLNTAHYKRGAVGNPRLVPVGGEIKVAGGILYNAQAAAARRKSIRNISERPAFIYRK